MPVSATAPFFDPNWALVDGQTQQATEWFRKWLEQITSAQTAIIAALNAVIGVNVFTLAGQPALGAGDAGYIGYVTDYAHLVKWSGSAWEFLGGGNKYFALFEAAPSGNGWQLCNGTVSDFLTLGATLTTTPFTVPNVPAGTFLKAVAAYTGAIDAAIAPGISGRTDTVSDTGGGNDMDIFGFNAGGGATNVISGASKFTHNHDTGSLAVDSAARPPALGSLLYFRR